MDFEKIYILYYRHQIKVRTVLSLQKSPKCPYPINFSLSFTTNNHESDFYQYGFVLPVLELCINEIIYVLILCQLLLLSMFTNQPHCIYNKDTHFKYTLWWVLTDLSPCISEILSRYTAYPLSKNICFFIFLVSYLSQPKANSDMLHHSRFVFSRVP